MFRVLALRQSESYESTTTVRRYDSTRNHLEIAVVSVKTAK